MLLRGENDPPPPTSSRTGRRGMIGTATRESRRGAMAQKGMGRPAGRGGSGCPRGYSGVDATTSAGALRGKDEEGTWRKGLRAGVALPGGRIPRESGGRTRLMREAEGWTARREFCTGDRLQEPGSRSIGLAERCVDTLAGRGSRRFQCPRPAAGMATDADLACVLAPGRAARAVRGGVQRLSRQYQAHFAVTAALGNSRHPG